MYISIILFSTTVVIAFCGFVFLAYFLHRHSKYRWMKHQEQVRKATRKRIERLLQEP